MIYFFSYVSITEDKYTDRHGIPLPVVQYTQKVNTHTIERRVIYDKKLDYVSTTDQKEDDSLLYNVKRSIKCLKTKGKNVERGI